MAETDSFGNRIDPELSYATGDTLGTAEDQYDEALEARRIIRARWESGGAEAIFNFSGLERGFPAGADDLRDIDDETAPALYENRFTQLTLDHFGGNRGEHDAFLANRMTAATASTFMTLVGSGQTVVGVAPNNSHASVVRSAGLVDADFEDTNSAEEFVETFESADDVGLVALSRMDVTYEILDETEVERVIEFAHRHDVPVFLDDAGGARVAPALFGRRRSLELGVDIVSTGLDKYGVSGPRFGALAGTTDLVRRIRSEGWKFGLEARPTFIVGATRSLERYDPERVRERHAATEEVGDALRTRLDDIVSETSSVVKLAGEDVLRAAMNRAGTDEPPLVPIEATAALSMVLLRDHGIITVHFAGIPSGTPDLLLKFLPPAEIGRFGGPAAVAEAVDDSISEVAALLGDPGETRSLLLND